MGYTTFLLQEKALNRKHQAEIDKLRGQLAEANAALNADWGDGVMQENLKAKKQITLLREALESLAYHIDLDVTKNVLKRIASRALAATEMPDVVICDAEPVAWATMLGDFAHVHWGKDRPDFPIRYEFPLYARRKP